MPIYVQIVVDVLMLLGVLFLLPARARLRQLADNDLRHMQEQLDRIEQKLAEHVQWHLNHK